MTKPNVFVSLIIKQQKDISMLIERVNALTEIWQKMHPLVLDTAKEVIELKKQVGLHGKTSHLKS